MYFGLVYVDDSVPVVVLFGRAVWFIADFLGKYAALNIKSLNPARMFT
jgi:hypothetical protein